MSNRLFLSELHRCCSVNYVRLMQLLRGWEDWRQDFCLTTELEYLQHKYLLLRLIEDAPYTSTLIMSTESNVAFDFIAPKLTIRIYHDAQMAEVLDGRQIRQLLGRYDYPNADMHQPDEKLQLNRFLGEWLQHCLDHGFRITPHVVDPGSS